MKIVKYIEDERLVFGWANVAVDVGGNQIEDWQEDLIDPDELEKAAYMFNLEYRATGEMHKGTTKGQMVESLAVTKEKLEALELPEGSLPLGWWVGFYIEDQEVFNKVKDGTYKMFSIQGRAERSEI